ncbi:outer membrane beta-barrel family protein [Flavilitoribacter nigricans]|uniref:TonB-dependent receptor n=1 Tax=Flavilitoribacter nigricans (strain ATCC 23147 / DSM 23189 / NBRC 102662 / NCIMB 1420 / SS-2) TaxID=1122177 RepID=A0A2D0N6H0_FLAN2|nr:outer membrane beta-barrel family protein [Flavilitoribacter nigricans]PHN03749.1 TonB-dependent receptor [Flavilitoribacter nigricans DSM 23189 = NBRC 102662]
MKKEITLLYVLLLVFTQLSAQSNGKAIVDGFVQNERSEAVDFANVLLLQPSDSSLIKGAITDSTGYFAFEDLASGQYLIQANLIGYKPVFSAVIELNAANPKFRLPTLQLNTDAAQLSEVVVSAQKPFIELRADKLVVNVESSPVAAGNNALELLSKAPGVVLDQNNNISLKGKQGVLILINGKQSYLSNEEVVRMLESTPADAIERIEIMLNPSAKYDASGNAGIINIQMKKDKNLGFNANLRVGGGVGSFPKANGGLRFNYRQKDYNLYGNYDYYFNRSFQDLDIDRTVPYDGGLTSFDQFNHSIREYGSHRVQLGWDWFLGEKTTIGALFNGRFGTWKQKGNNSTAISGPSPWDYSLIDAGSYHKDNWDNYTYNINFKHAFDDNGKELTVDIDYSDFINGSNSDYFNYFLNDNQEEVAAPNLLQANNFSDVSIKAAKVDYTQPIGEKTKIELGAKSSIVSTDNGIEFQKQEDGDWVIDDSRTNQFQYEETIHAAYANFSHQFKGLMLQLGLRSEYTISDGMSVTLDERVKRDYLDLFPSVSLSHSVGKAHNLSYAYSRRIDRPSYQDLNPFIFFLDQFTFGKGNPFLQPQYTDSYSINYSLNNRFVASLSYSHTKDAMTEVLEQDNESQATFQTYRNLANFDNISLNLSAPFTLSEWYTLRLSVTGYQNSYRSPFMDGELDSDQFSYNFYVANNFNLPGDFKAELTGYYQSAFIYSIFQGRPQYSIDFGLNKTILDGKGKISLNVNDIFNTRQFEARIRQADLNLDLVNKNESRRINLTFNYSFGNSEVKPARRRNTATDDEQSRVKQN